MEVASRAAINTMMHRLRKAAMKRHPGWNFSVFGDISDVESLVRDWGAEAAGLTSSPAGCVDGVDMLMPGSNVFEL
jgi:hypothetical protein